MRRSMDNNKLTEVFNSPHWIRAVILRDPATRLLSAFNNKVVTNHGGHVFPSDLKVPKGTDRLKAFDNLLQLIDENYYKKNRMHQLDGHFRPQADVCHKKWLGCYFNFVGYYDELSNHTKILLELQGLWRKFGSIPSSGFLQGGGPATGHKTSHKVNMTKFLTLDRMNLIRKLYKVKYLIA